MLLLPDTETTIESAAQFQPGDATLLVIGTASDHPAQEVDPAHLPGDVEVESRDLQVRSISIDMCLVLQVVDAEIAQRYEALIGNVAGADPGIEIVTGTGTVIETRIKRADAQGTTKSLEGSLAPAVGVTEGIRVETGRVKERGVEVAAPM